MSAPQFFQQPFRYLRWASHEKPAIFYSFIVGSFGPLSLVIAPPIRRYFNDGPREKIPMTYPSKLP
ncbi:putative NADH-ubiquinone oxidoreductase 9.5 kDa subunit [Usnea florida]